MLQWTPVMKQGLDLLVGSREECEVPQENIYLFARPSALTCYRGSDCLVRNFAKVYGAKSPESLTSTKLRKQTGTLSQVLNLSNTGLDQGRLAEFKGKTLDDINIDPEGSCKSQIFGVNWPISAQGGLFLLAIHSGTATPL
ncbi:hypothetical protein F2P79_023560 [Pimephales promelas]|nr:hypothetical protein F2P79_023560 [Pimephales promelas]